ncbi:MAG: hypothetical protein GAK35_01622 [Herbaspirillum frisingense]|uniref:GGDEF domain-containing protein n=1 Tax=Herbaspirillum frisingense TaxID=92645 RepID=A0A7V8FXQ8_9BURK|nr:MAG: hypothetical protein GAK35_01622 [Herbaspirillum frisingense]
MERELIPMYGRMPAGETRRSGAGAHHARIDVLTGLAGREMLDMHMARASARGRGGAGVLLMGLDGFRQINDVNGHQSETLS